MSRVIRKLNSAGLEEVPFASLRKNDIFMAYDDGELVTDKDGYNTFKALSDPYIKQETGKLLIIDCEAVVG